jgi:hypothetical protein
MDTGTGMDSVWGHKKFLQKFGGEVSWLLVSVEGWCECGNGPSGSHKAEDIYNNLRYYSILGGTQ